MSETDDAILAGMKVAAQKAGMIDLDGLKLADMSKVTLEADGTIAGVEKLMISLRERWPDLFARHVRNMSEIERAAKLAELRKGPAPQPMPTDRKAKDMSPAERAEFIREVNRRFG